MQFSHATITQLCSRYGPQILLPASAGVDGARLLWALAGAESSFGADANPRHEPAYCRGGKLHSEILSSAWGCLAHCSYGPWQVMFANATPGISPLQMAIDPDIGARLATRLLGRIAIEQGAKSVDELAEAYNTGRIRPDPAYVARVKANYEMPMPGVF